MSSTQSIISEIEMLRSDLEKLKPLQKVDAERLWKKFRLEWNYNSNHIEGNTLTFGQTELLLMFDKTTGDHEMREFEEMKAHDAVVHLVRDYAADKNRELTESDIRQWNKVILVRPFWTNAQTEDRQPTRKLVTPGEYKKEPNSVLLSNGEMFHYASPEETPVKMNELMDWYRTVSREKKLHPVEIAALLHYKFVCIHPFDDCNGRTSRLLMNYVLFKNDYPPVIIKSADKKNYLNALNRADVGDLDAFVRYIAAQLIWSLGISISAAGGKSVEDDDDVDKELQVLTRGFPSNMEAPVKSEESLIRLFKTSIRDFLNAYFERVIKLSSLIAYTKINIGCSTNGSSYRSKYFDSHTDFGKSNEFVTNYFSEYSDQISSQSKEKVFVDVTFKGIKKDLSIAFESKSNIELSFESYYYEIKSNEFDVKKLYSQVLTTDEIRQYVNILYKSTVLLAKESIENK